MGIPVKLPAFEGPLDLLLHLIESNKIDIYDIPIVTITDQYMEYIRAMEKKDLNVMSEFLVMAATLLEYRATGYSFLARCFEKKYFLVKYLNLCTAVPETHGIVCCSVNRMESRNTF